MSSAVLPQRDVRYLLGCTALNTVALLEQLPLWLPVLFVCIALWRLRDYRAAQTLATPLKIALVMVSSGGLYISQGSFFNVEAMLSLLVLAASLKIVELSTGRDFLLLLFLGIFVSACQLLFSSSIVGFLYALCCQCLLLVTLLIHISGRASRKAVKTVSVMMFQALPLAVVLFLAMPRLGSFWHIPLASDVAKTGISDSLSAGEFSALSEDHSVAMRVTFAEGAKPDLSELYWRGLVLSELAGNTWREGEVERNAGVQAARQLAAVSARSDERGLRYQVMLEPTGNPWLYALDLPRSAEPGVFTKSDFTLSYRKPIDKRLAYDVESWPPHVLDGRRAEDMKRFLALPAQGNPRARELGEQLRLEHQSTGQIIEALLTLYRQGFSYTLQPGKLARKDPLDDFLFEQRRGYCEYFASSSALVLRAAGIPTRIVTGYQGGQWGGGGDYLLVTQADAHAWLEVWYAGVGWRRVDPTSAVAPERIELGQAGFNTAREATDGGFDLSFIGQLGLQLDRFDYQWHRLVLGYDNQLQLQLIRALLGELAGWKILLVLLTAGGVPLVAWCLTRVWRQRRATAPEIRALQRLERIVGMRRPLGQTVSAWLHQVASHHRGITAECEELAKIYNTLMYTAPVPREQHQQLLGRIAQLHKRIKHCT
ncbi:MAG: transglutaminaseTgpA domain-containing protein [Pseudomonadales bacterium]